MTKGKLICLFIIFVFLLGSVENVYPENGEKEEVTQLLQKWVDLDQKSPGVVLGIVDLNGQRIYAHGFFSREGAPVTADTIFEIGSLTKVFSALLMAEMARRGELDPDRPVAAYLPPEIRLPSFKDQPILLAQLAIHTSGLPRMQPNHFPANFLDPYADYTAERMLKFLAGYELTRLPGVKYEYSNLGYGLLGYTLAQIAKKDFSALLTERVLSPLGLKDTMINVPEDQKKRLAVPHGWAGQPVSYWRIPGIPACGALNSTVPDLLHFLAVNLGLDESVSETLDQAMIRLQQPWSGVDESGKSFNEWVWGLEKVEGRNIFWHDGGTGGFRSFIGFSPELKRGVAVLANGVNGCRELAMALLQPQEE